MKKKKKKKKKHKESTCKASGRSVIFSSFYADFCLCPKSEIITTSVLSSLIYPCCLFSLDIFLTVRINCLKISFNSLLRLKITVLFLKNVVGGIARSISLIRLLFRISRFLCVHR